MPLYQPGQTLIPLTVELIRSKYLGPNQKYKRIEHYSPQSDADRLRILDVNYVDGAPFLTLQEEYDVMPKYDFEWEPNIFVDEEPLSFYPDGDLIIEEEGLCESRSRIKHWLQRGRQGPYLKDQHEPFYYLSGKAGFDRHDVQVAANPFNTLTYDAMDSMTMWVLDDTSRVRKHKNV